VLQILTEDIPNIAASRMPSTAHCAAGDNPFPYAETPSAQSNSNKVSISACDAHPSAANNGRLIDVPPRQAIVEARAETIFVIGNEGTPAAFRAQFTKPGFYVRRNLQSPNRETVTTRKSQQILTIHENRTIRKIVGKSYITRRCLVTH
jgi:hypothetical protein